MTKSISKKSLPEFANEREEGQWYKAHRDELDDYFEPVSQQEEVALQEEVAFLNMLKHLPPKENVLAQIEKVQQTYSKKTMPTSIRLSREDIDKAKGIAAQKGLSYQTWIKSIIHQAIERELVRTSK